MQKSASEMTFGVEIECYVPYESLTRAGWAVGAYHAGRPVPGHAGWKAEADGSLNTSAPSLDSVMQATFIRSFPCENRD